MKKDWKYILYLCLAVAAFVAVKMIAPRDLDWRITYHPEDRNPFGAYALGQLIDNIFPKDKIQKSNYTIYELYDSLKRPGNFLSISSSFSPGKADTDALMERVRGGGTVFIAAQYFTGEFADTLKLGTSDYFFDNSLQDLFNQNDPSAITFKNPDLAHENPYSFPRKNINNYFEMFDSTRTTIVAVNDLKLPVIIRMNWGKGNLYLSSIPLAFTNIHLLEGENIGFAERALSCLPNSELEWTEFYQLGRMEIQSPLRFVLTTPSLTWAYYITIASILLFMLFEIKRKQRIIPIIKPLGNSTLEFVRTIGNLYYQNKDHKNIAEKKINFFFEQMRSHYFINTNVLDEKFKKTFEKKTGRTQQEIHDLFASIASIQAKAIISANELIDLNKKLEQFTPGSQTRNQNL